MNGDQYNEEELLQAIRNRDRKAFEALYDRYSPMVHGLVLRVVVNPELAKEVVQDVFLRVWNNIDSYNKFKGRLSTWLMNIARNRAIDHTRSKAFKKQQANQELENSVYQSGKPGTVQPKIEVIGVKKYPAMLRPEQQHLLELIYFKGFTHEEAARELNIPIGTVKTRIRTSLLALRKILKVE